MTNMEHYKWLWGQWTSLTLNQKDKLVREIIARADLETFKWLWGQRTSLTLNQKDKLVREIIARADLETFKWLWGQGTSLTLNQKDKLVGEIIARADLETFKWLWEQRISLTLNQKDKIFQAMLKAEKNRSSHLPLRQKESVAPSNESNRGNLFKYDVFICHASEDKDSFVRVLAEKLSSKDLRVWYDEFTLSLGDSLRRSIDCGLAKSRYGAVVLSTKFFEKEWPQKELDALVTREDGWDKVILPIWHGVTKKQVQSFSLILADRLAVSTNEGIDHVVNEILKVVKRKSV